MQVSVLRQLKSAILSVTPPGRGVACFSWSVCVMFGSAIYISRYLHLFGHQGELIVGDQSGALHLWDLRSDHNEQLVSLVLYAVLLLFLVSFCFVLFRLSLCRSVCISIFQSLSFRPFSSLLSISQVRCFLAHWSIAIGDLGKKSFVFWLLWSMFDCSDVSPFGKASAAVCAS